MIFWNFSSQKHKFVVLRLIKGIWSITIYTEAKKHNKKQKQLLNVRCLWLNCSLISIFYYIGALNTSRKLVKTEVFKALNNALSSTWNNYFLDILCFLKLFQSFTINCSLILNYKDVGFGNFILNTKTLMSEVSKSV